MTKETTVKAIMEIAECANGFIVAEGTVCRFFKTRKELADYINPQTALPMQWSSIVINSQQVLLELAIEKALAEKERNKKQRNADQSGFMVDFGETFGKKLAKGLNDLDECQKAQDVKVGKKKESYHIPNEVGSLINRAIRAGYAGRLNEFILHVDVLKMQANLQDDGK